MTLSPDEREAGRVYRAAKTRDRKAQRKGRPARVQPIADGRQRAPRIHDKPFLAFLRRQRCAVANGMCSLCIDAAHIRMHKPGELPTGLQRKPDDNRAVPLCRHHHSIQHSMNEAVFWIKYGKDPFALAADLYAQFTATAEARS